MVMPCAKVSLEELNVTINARNRLFSLLNMEFSEPFLSRAERTIRELSIYE